MAGARDIGEVCNDYGMVDLASMFMELAGQANPQAQGPDCTKDDLHYPTHLPMPEDMTMYMVRWCWSMPHGRIHPLPLSFDTCCVLPCPQNLDLPEDFGPSSFGLNQHQVMETPFYEEWGWLADELGKVKLYESGPESKPVNSAEGLKAYQKVCTRYLGFLHHARKIPLEVLSTEAFTHQEYVMDYLSLQLCKANNLLSYKGNEVAKVAKILSILHRDKQLSQLKKASPTMSQLPCLYFQLNNK